MNQTRSKIGLRKRIVFSLVATVAFFGIAEIAFRGLEWVRPPRHVDFGLGFNDDSRVFVESKIQPGRMETHPAKRISFVRQQFQRTKPDGVFRILALGGSSVNYLEPEFKSLEQDLTDEFQDKYKQVEIINCGGFAYGSGRLVLVFREMLEYDPDLLVLYTGHNEFEEVEQLRLSKVEHLGYERAISKSAIVRFLRDRRTDFELGRLEKEHNGRVLASVEPVSESNFARAWSHEFKAEDVEERMRQFEHNLQLVLTQAERQQIPIVMGSVSSNLMRPYIPRQAASRYEQVYELWSQGKVQEGSSLARQILRETLGRHQCSDLENEILRKLAREHSAAWVDVDALVIENEPHGIPGETLFDDHCHLNAQGRAVWISGYGPAIRDAIRGRPIR